MFSDVHSQSPVKSPLLDERIGSINRKVNIELQQELWQLSGPTGYSKSHWIADL